MAFSLDNLLESVVPAVISGGGTAISTILAFFRDIKKKIEELEKKVGSIDGKSGLLYSMHLAEEGIKKLKEQLEERDHHDPPQARRRSGSFTNEFVPWDEIQDFIKKEVARHLEDLEERLEKLEGKVKKLVTDEEFEQADHARAGEIAQVKHTMAEIRGLLQGLQAALGLIKPPNR
jgi:Glu-tRNA(Gln) amidotransferase subunit E-like FAD-binding protein